MSWFTDIYMSLIGVDDLIFFAGIELLVATLLLVYVVYMMTWRFRK